MGHKIERQTRTIDNDITTTMYQLKCNCGWISIWSKDYKAIEKESRRHYLEVERGK